MAKVASRARVSAHLKQTPQTEHDPHAEASITLATETEQAPDPLAQQHLLTMTEDEGLQIQEARCMLQLLEDMTLSGEHEITLSSGPLAVMMAVIQKKLAFKPRLMPVDAAGILRDR